ncbi:MAG TPA: AsmA-like C-terminal region-containing protein [Flavobacteriaceae bacterium]|nr:AsmA-like C-terminal region-containing protein [Flavobacteriaceae bacterium]
MKKILKITGISLAVLLILLLLSPFIFKGSLERLLKKTINEKAPVNVEWSKLDLSLIRSFPKSSLTLSDFSVTTRGVFEGDTLASGDKLRLELGIMQIIKGTTPLTIDAFRLEGGLIQIKTDAEGRSNYDFSDSDIDKEDSDAEDSGDFSLALTKYDIIDTDIHYFDEKSGIFLSLSDIQHIGKGDFAMAKSELDTQTKAIASFAMDGTEYLSNQRIALDAIIEMDLDNMKFSFLENQAKVNELPLTFDGYVQMLEDYNDVAISFSTPSSDFKNFLGVIPKEYLKHLDGVQTTGNFEVNGNIEGRVDETYIPKMDIHVKSTNASFNYPDLPKAMQDIFIDLALRNDTGLMKDMYLNIGDLRFRIGNNPFAVKGSVHNFMDNALVDLMLKGTLNLEEIKEVVPLENDLNLAGVFKADMQMKFDMQSIEKERYDRVVSKGTASLSDFVYTGDAFKNDFHIASTKVSFNPQSIRLDSFQATTGKTDLAATGNIDNFIQFIMNGKELKGRFNVTSNAFHLSDFMVEEEEDSKSKAPDKKLQTAEGTVFKIPAFLDASLNFNAKEVYYDNLVLKNTSGTAAIANETASISNLKSDIFGGLLALSGDVSTSGEIPKFHMNVSLQKVKIEETFKGMEFIRFIAPIANAFHGILDTQFNLAGDLSKDFTPKLETLNGNAVIDILSANINPADNKTVANLSQQLSFLNIEKLNLKDIHSTVQFKDGEIKMNPLEYSWRDMQVKLDGVHSLTNEMKYNANFDIPAKYLGKEATNLLARLSPEEAEKQHILLPVYITGSGTSPKIKVDTKAAIESLTAGIIDHQKDKVKDKIEDKKEEIEDKLRDKGKDLLDGIIPGRGKDSTATDKNPGTKTDSTQTEKEQSAEDKVKDKVKEGLKDLFGKGKKKD